MLAMNYFDVLIWPGGGSIGIVLWCMSILALALIVQCFIAVRRANMLPIALHEQIQEMFKAKQYREVIDLTASEPSLLSRVVHSGLAEASHGYPAMERAMEEAYETQSTIYLRKIEWLNLMGNVSPMLGLLGTVWGMINAFFTITEKGGAPDAGALSQDIGMALVTTLIGLAIAIPALAVYGIMRNKIDSLSSEALVISQDLISTFRPTAKKSGS